MDTKIISVMLSAAILCFAILGTAADDSLATKCSSEFQKVAQCLPFATAKVAAPSKDCCDSVTELKQDNPACLCFFIQQIHNGTSTVKDMGIQEARLLQLPSACKMVNASVSECPKLLHLPPNSPDASIFTNANVTAATTTVATPGASSTTAPSNGHCRKPGYLAVAMAILFHAFRIGSVSI